MTEQNSPERERVKEAIALALVQYTQAGERGEHLTGQTCIDQILATRGLRVEADDQSLPEILNCEDCPTPDDKECWDCYTYDGFKEAVKAGWRRVL